MRITVLPERKELQPPILALVCKYACLVKDLITLWGIVRGKMDKRRPASSQEILAPLNRM
jgi:hypothetical protein